MLILRTKVCKCWTGTFGITIFSNNPIFMVMSCKNRTFWKVFFCKTFSVIFICLLIEFLCSILWGRYLLIFQVLGGCTIQPSLHHRWENVPFQTSKEHVFVIGLCYFLSVAILDTHFSLISAKLSLTKYDCCNILNWLQVSDL